MKRIAAIFCAFALLCTQAFSQNISLLKDEQSDEKDLMSYRMNEPGDQFIKIGLMVTFPLNFGGDFPLYRDGQLSTGGAGSLGYHRFITSEIAAGFDVQFGYNPTIGENIFTYVPFIFSVTYQPTWNRLEFPMTLGLGFAMENYLNRTYFPGFVLKPQAGIFYRVSPGWSFGVEGDFMYLPQHYDNSKYDDYGNFASFMIAARYHF